MEDRRHESRRAMCMDCPLNKDGVCQEHSTMIIRGKYSGWTLIVVLIGLFSTMAGLYWRIGDNRDTLTTVVVVQQRVLKDVQSVVDATDRMRERVGAVETEIRLHRQQSGDMR